ncbi:MAG: ComF family protein [Paenibacillaceae bacterium]
MFKSLISKLRSTGRSLLAPNVDSCLVCHGLRAGSSGELPLCRKCYTSIPWIKPNDIACSVCGRYEQCTDCIRRKLTWFESNLSVVRYDDVMKDWLGRFKYRGDEGLQLLFAGMFESLFQRFLANHTRGSKDIALITYVPLSRQRLEERGFNQAELFARALGNSFRIPVAPLLERALHTGKQSYKTRSERIHDLRGVFVLNQAGAERLSAGDPSRPNNIIIVDDVYTTGSTMNECARIVKEALPNLRVFSLTWAR